MLAILNKANKLDIEIVNIERRKSKEDEEIF